MATVMTSGRLDVQAIPAGLQRQRRDGHLAEIRSRGVVLVDAHGVDEYRGRPGRGDRLRHETRESLQGAEPERAEPIAMREQHERVGQSVARRVVPHATGAEPLIDAV